MAEIKDNPIINSIAQAGQAQAASQNAALAIHQQLDQEDMASSAAVIARSAMGNAEATMSSEKNAWEAASDSKVAETRAFMGADPTLQGSLSNKWLQRMNEAAEKQYQSLDVIQEKQSKTLLNDPLGFIAAQFTLPADIATHNYYNQQRATAEEQLNEITSASDANVIAVQRAKQHTSTEYAIAESEKAKQGAEFDNAQLISRAAGTRIQGLAELNNLTQQQLNVAFQVHAAANSDAQLAETKKLHEDNLALRKERLDAQSGQDADQEAMRIAYNASAKRMGKPTIDDPISWKRYFAVQLKNPDFQDMLGQGQDIMLQNGVTNGVAMSGSAGKTALLYSSGSTVGLKQDQVGSFLADQVTSVKALPNAPKDREALAGAVTERATAEATRMRAQIRDDHANIYAAPPPAVVLTAVGPATDPFLASVLKPIVDADPKVKMDDGTLFGKAFEFAQGSPGNFNVAADGLTNYYKMAVLKNNLLNQYTEKGLPAQTNYPVVIQGKVIDATNPVDVKKALIRSLVGESGVTAARLTGNYNLGQ
jgi:hypothetical protein